MSTIPKQLHPIPFEPVRRLVHGLVQEGEPVSTLTERLRSTFTPAQPRVP